MENFIFKNGTKEYKVQAASCQAATNKAEMYVDIGGLRPAADKWTLCGIGTDRIAQNPTQVTCQKCLALAVEASK